MSPSFTMLEEWYSLKNFANDLHILLVNETKDMHDKCYERPPYPATWIRNYGKGGVFYTSMGHREDVWASPQFQSLVVGGISWAVGDVEGGHNSKHRERDTEGKCFTSEIDEPMSSEPSWSRRARPRMTTD